MVVLKVERQADFLDAKRLSRVMLDNQSAEPTPSRMRRECNTVFGAGAEQFLTLPEAGAP